MASKPAPHTDDTRPVPGFGGPNSAESTPDGQSALRLHAGIAVIATLLCAFVTVVFVIYDATVLAVVFAVITLGCVAAFIWAVRRKRRGERAT